MGHYNDSIPISRKRIMNARTELIDPITQLNSVNSDQLVDQLAPALKSLKEQVAIAMQNIQETNGSPEAAIQYQHDHSSFQTLFTAISTALKANNTATMTPTNHIGK